MDVSLHERRLSVESSKASPAIDTVAMRSGIWSPDWPAMVLDRGLTVGSSGGHGIMGCSVDEYVPGQRVRFTFSAPRGFHGWHEFTVVPADGCCDLRHTLVVEPVGLTRVLWPMVLRPLHDALVEDAFDEAEQRLTGSHTKSEWSWWVRLLRRVFLTLQRFRRG